MRDRLERVPFHPVLLAIFPILFLYEYNIGFAPMSELGLPLLAACILVAGLWALFGWLLRSANKGALMASAVVVFLLAAGRLLDVLLAALPAGTNVRATGLGLAVVALLAAGGVGWALAKAPRRLPKLTFLANLVALSLVLQSGAAIGLYNATKTPFREDPPALHLQGPLSDQPDIYFLVLDEYSAPSTLRATWDFDDGSFVANLSSAGFQVLTNSTANYPKTILSLASILNMEYLPNGTADREAEALPMVRHPEAIAALQAVGYKWVHFDTAWEPTIRNDRANYNVECGLSDFQIELVHETALRATQDLWYPGDLLKQQRINCQFDELSNLSSLRQSLGGPLFVFDHLLVPHMPYVFGPNGERVAWGNNESLSVEDEKEAYREQVAYTNARVLEAVRSIESHAARPPVILLLSDNGEYPAKAWDWSNATVNATMRTLLAVANPGGAKLPDNLTMVNLFRYLFNEDFGTNMSILPPENWFLTGDPNVLVNKTAELYPP